MKSGQIQTQNGSISYSTDSMIDADILQAVANLMSNQSKLHSKKLLAHLEQLAHKYNGVYLYVGHAENVEI